MNNKIYGIDLGTTNSLICLDGKELHSDLIKSLADLKKQTAGNSLIGDTEAKSSFKIDMSSGKEGIMPRTASALVLKELIRVSGKKVRCAVITVPAYFNSVQRKATRMSAKTAGIEEVYIVNEPTAAAMWIARDYRTTLLVFDLGGGTFDVSVVCNLYNCYDVLVTEGCAVGGNDFDKAITEYFLRTSHIAPYHLSNEQLQKLTWLATETKIKMQKERSAFRVDLTHFGAGYIDFTEKCYIKIMKRTFAKTIELTKQIIERAALGNADLKFAFAGGSTRCPYLREWVKEVFRQPIVPQNYDPDKVVGLGASYYAGMVEKGKIREYVSDVTKKLTIGYSDGTALTIIEEDSKIPINSDEIPIVNDKPCDTISLSIYEGNSNKVSENTFIGELRFRYSKFMESEEGLVIIQAKIDRSGIITFTAREPAGKTQEIQIKC